MGRKAVARAYSPRGRDKKTASFVPDDPSGRGSGWNSSKLTSSADEVIARKFWDETEPWPVYWARWQREFEEKKRESYRWLKDFEEHGVAYANKQRKLRQRRETVMIIVVDGRGESTHGEATGRTGSRS